MKNYNIQLSFDSSHLYEVLLSSVIEKYGSVIKDIERFNYLIGEDYTNVIAKYEDLLKRKEDAFARYKLDGVKQAQGVRDTCLEGWKASLGICLEREKELEQILIAFKSAE